MDLFFDGGLVLVWLFLTYKLLSGRVKWFWFLIWVTYSMIATALFMFLDIRFGA